MFQLPSARPLFLGLAGMMAVVVAAGLLALPSHAVNSKVRNACKDDYFRYCPNYEPDSTKARQCMRQVGKRLSPACVDALVATGQIKKRR